MLTADRGPALRSSVLRDLARLFLKLGTIGFGGPAAHIALMEHEVVRRRGWLSSRIHKYSDVLSLDFWRLER